MTYITYKYSNFPSTKVIGTGTSLDTARLQLMIGKKLCINPKNVQGYVMGEHGDSEFIPWSNANISLQSIKEFLSTEELQAIEHDVKNAAYEIIERKGATYYGIGMTLVRITNAILGNENLILPLSVLDKENDMYIGRPCIIGIDGIRDIKLNLTDEENFKYKRSINILKDEIKNLQM
jgi:L-lactate dehydrogenase